MAVGTERAAASADDVWVPRPWVVRSATREIGDTVTLEIEPRDASAARPVAPGQFMMLYIFGVGEVPISVSGTGPTSGLLHTVRDVGAVTHALCNLGVGDVLGARGPFGSAWPIDEHKGCDVVIAAGGIGLAPLRPVVRHVLERRGEYDDVVVLYGSRQPDQLLYTPEFERWRAAGIQVEVTVDHADQTWDGHIGVVPTLVRHARFQVDEAAAFLCGPEVMMRFMAQELVDRGVVPERIHLSLERNMKCAVGMCGRCQLGPEFLCLDGPVFPWTRVERLMAVPEL